MYMCGGVVVVSLQGGTSHRRMPKVHSGVAKREAPAVRGGDGEAVSGRGGVWQVRHRVSGQARALDLTFKAGFVLSGAGRP